MRSCRDRRAIGLLLSVLPSYLVDFEARAAWLGDELCAVAIFSDLGEQVDALVSRSRDHKDEARLEEVLDAIEAVLTDRRVDVHHLSQAFLAALSPAARQSVDAYLRPVTAALLADDAPVEFDEPFSRAARPPLRSRPRRYNGRGPRKRRRL